jgi:hypothetical protein
MDGDAPGNVEPRACATGGQPSLDAESAAAGA